jgi:hypothetical protein
MITILLCCIAGIFKAARDLSAHGKPFWFTSNGWSKNVNVGYASPKYDWWYMNRSWRLKWKNGDPLQGERFWGSSRWAVMFTDFWHLAQFFFLNLMIAAMVCYEPIVNGLVDFIILGVVLRGVFELFYKYILIKKEQK